MADGKKERLAKAITWGLKKYPQVYDCRQATVRKVLAKQLASDILEWYEKEKNGSK